MCVCVCVCVCVRACVRACVRVCLCVDPGALFLPLALHAYDTRLSATVVRLLKFFAT